VRIDQLTREWGAAVQFIEELHQEHQMRLRSRVARFFVADCSDATSVRGHISHCHEWAV